jgi:hypothetical protein
MNDKIIYFFFACYPLILHSLCCGIIKIHVWDAYSSYPELSIRLLKE